MSDAPRLLAARSEYGYTDHPSLALGMEPEAVSAEEQNVISIRARSQFAEAHQEEVRRRDNSLWLERLRKAEMRANSMGVDIFRHQAQIRRHILAIEHRLTGGTLIGGTLASA